MVTARTVAEPGLAASSYSEQYAAYRELYPALAPWFQRAQTQR
jgi:hypothetical protein